VSFWQSARDELKRCFDLLLPPAWLLCGERLPAGLPATDLCPTCHDGLPQPTPTQCSPCAAAYHSPMPTLHHCEVCLRHPLPFVKGHAVGPYAVTLQDAIQRFKYHGQLPLERPLGTLLFETELRGGGPRPNLVAAAPLHKNRLRGRG
jgi:predicted amidophosphoribosyltransferase